MYPNKNEILQRLYNLMEEHGTNAKQLTETLNMSASSFTDWKKGRASPGVEALYKMAGYFNVSLDYLVTGEDFRPVAPDDKPQEVPEPPRQAENVLDFSNPVDAELLKKFRRLPPEYQGKVFSYIDGMLAVLPLTAESEDVRLLG